MPLILFADIFYTLSPGKIAITRKWFSEKDLLDKVTDTLSSLIQFKNRESKSHLFSGAKTLEPSPIPF